jgi:hypothetical protein
MNKKQRHCMRCGRRIFNPSDICFECNEEWQTYMKDHPLKTNIDYSRDNVEQKLREMREESNKRWKDFIGEKVMFT